MPLKFPGRKVSNTLLPGFADSNRFPDNIINIYLKANNTCLGKGGWVGTTRRHTVYDWIGPSTKLPLKMHRYSRPLRWSRACPEVRWVCPVPLATIRCCSCGIAGNRSPVFVARLQTLPPAIHRHILLTNFKKALKGFKQLLKSVLQGLTRA